eukprot:CAMPEP_0116881198 /NCGR_PEP_ID=MMETSP0463-20121206/13301_1 /TAXON_ID=181622 /ORGANISM="Strombidinopsis sp, Strain SopsisLIS2011" /LENGTH=31 /DNA_ID= /DNA_START= /DNA_END= /DNA_ORIENTATION=
MTVALPEEFPLVCLLIGGFHVTNLYAKKKLV